MKKRAAILLAILFVILSGCAPAPALPKPSDLTMADFEKTDDGYAFPLLAWGATEEDAREAMPELDFTRTEISSGGILLEASCTMLDEDGTLMLIFSDDGKLTMARFNVDTEDAAGIHARWVEAAAETHGKASQQIEDADGAVPVYRWDAAGSSTSFVISALGSNNRKDLVGSTLAEAKRIELVWQAS